MKILKNADSSAALSAEPGSFSPFSVSNIRLFLIFRIFFNARFYYPVFSVLFLDFGLSLEQFAILNSVWAVTIVLLEVPSGALADTLGRRNLLRVAAILMFLEMSLICLLQPGANQMVFWIFVINRILSGAAEASASGADEALAYDSLVERGQQHSWPKVLEFLMRIQSIAFVVALLVGSAVYDASLINRILMEFNIQADLSAQQSMKFPFYLMLISSSVVLFATFRMKEVDVATKIKTDATLLQKCADALRRMYQAGRWILHSSQALLIISGGLIFDSILRMLLTLNSQYYRIIELPAWSFGICGAIFSMIGFFVPALATILSNRFSATGSFIMLSLTSLFAMIAMSLALPLLAGLIPFGFIFVVMYLVGYMVSKHLNEVTPSEVRATVLSFKGLAFNLAYAVVGMLYGFLAKWLVSKNALEGQGHQVVIPDTNQIFISSLSYFPGYFIVTLMLFAALALYFKCTVLLTTRYFSRPR